MRAGSLGGHAWAVDDSVVLSMEPFCLSPYAAFPSALGRHGLQIFTSSGYPSLASLQVLSFGT